MMQWQYSDLWDYEVVSGVSTVFVCLFFVPLVVVSVATAVGARTNLKMLERRLRIVWSAISVFPAFLIIMGHAFNYRTANPLIVIPVWFFSGYILIAIPLRIRAFFSNPEKSGGTSSSTDDAD